MDFDWQTLMASDTAEGSTRPRQKLQHSISALLPSQQHLSVPAQQEPAMGSSTSASQPPRTSRPAPTPSSSFPSIGSSPLPTSYSSPIPAQSRPSSKRVKNRKAQMDVKVLYTIDSHPGSTLVASLGRMASVQVVSFVSKDGRKRTSTFGKVTLKTCLSAICMASPELMIDRKEDYIIYAVDPIESYRAKERGGASTSSTSTRGVNFVGQQNDDEASKVRNAGGSPSSISSSSPSSSLSSYVVGKGFFTWALAEPDEGQSLVHGRVRDEYADEEDSGAGSDDDESDDDLQGKIVEVSLRLKAASSLSRDQYIDRVKMFQSTAAAVVPTSHPSFSKLGNRRDSATHSFSKQSEKQPQSASSPVTASEKLQSHSSTALTTTPAQQQLLMFLQALQAQAASSHSLQDDSNKSMESSGAPGQSISSISTESGLKSRTAASVGNSPDAMAQLLRNLAAGTSGNTGTDRSPLLRNAALQPPKASRATSTSVLEVKGMPESAASPILGGVTPGYDATYLSATSPASEMKATVPTNQSDSLTIKSEGNSGPSLPTVNGSGTGQSRLVGPSRSKQCCYNCGVRFQRSWRHIAIREESEVRFREGSMVYDHGKKLNRACNACGLYYNKYGGISRPEHVWREAQRQKTEHRREDAKNETQCACSSSHLDVKPNALLCANKQGASNNAANTAAAAARTKQLARTLSEACERDITRRTSVTREAQEDDTDQEMAISSGPLPRKMTNFEEARLKDYVQDSEGLWRTKRSILENPENKRPGRPKGAKTGQGQGRPRERRSRQKRASELAKLQQDMKQDQQTVTASSPGTSSDKAFQSASYAAQSSPLRSTSLLMSMARTPGSALNRTRYGAAKYLLDSSPATAFQTVLNEAETDWTALYGLSPRRSPRKNPQGTHGALNPYATLTSSPTSNKQIDERDRAPPGTLSSLDLLKLTSSSPLTRSRVKSGQYHLDDSWLSSDAVDFLGQQNRASSFTSPSSPSPSPAQLKSRSGKRKRNGEEGMLQPGQRSVSRTRPSKQIDTPVSAEKARKAARQARSGAAVTSEAGEISAMDAGPFMGLEHADATDEHNDDDDDEEEAGRGSPTLGRSRRLGQKSVSTGEPGSRSLQDSPARTDAVLDFNQDWLRTSSMRELFPTPSPVKQWTAQSPHTGLWQSPTSWALKPGVLSPQTKSDDGASTKATSNLGEENQNRGPALMELDVNQPQHSQQQLVRRKPLPATVEDAPSSVNSACSTPLHEDESGEDSEGGRGSSNLMDLFEDPYGLLAASGIGVQNNQPGLSMEDFDSIELFKGVDFNQQLDFFTQNGNTGIAAHVAPEHGGSSSTLKIEGGRKGELEAPPAPPVSTTTTPSTHTNNGTTATDFAELLKDPAMQALLAHMQLSPSKAATTQSSLIGQSSQ